METENKKNDNDVAYEKLFKKTDKEVMKLFGFRGVTNTDTLLGELIRRNTLAIKDFNRKSSFLSWAMIILALVSIITSIFIRYLPCKVNNP